MNSNLIAAIAVFFGGFAVSFLNYLISRNAVRKKSEKGIGRSAFIRQIINISYLIIVFAVIKFFEYDATYLMIGAVGGLTLPMFFFTYRLARENEMLNKQSEGDESNG